MMTSRFLALLILFATSFISSAVAYGQIGYQVALINNATGEPRALETVEVELTITDSDDTPIITETKKGTTNDFGILSLSIGNEDTFKEADWAKLPFYISTKADGKLISKTQILTVPVAEYAKNTGTLTEKILCSKSWTSYDTYSPQTFEFWPDGQGRLLYQEYHSDGYSIIYDGPINWYRQGNIVYATLIYPNETGKDKNIKRGYILHYIPDLNQFIFQDDMAGLIH